jgi:hypothetical protein
VQYCGWLLAETIRESRRISGDLSLERVKRLVASRQAPEELPVCGS